MENKISYASFISTCLKEDYVQIESHLSKDKTLINQRDERLGLSPLFHAVLHNNSKLALELLKLGADPNLSNTNKEIPLHEAADSSCMEIAEYLINYGSDINAMNLKAESPLHHATFRGNINIVRLLIRYNARLDIGQETPLHIAVTEGHMHCIEVLLAAGADQHILNADNKTPRDLAIEKNMQKFFMLSRSAILDTELWSITEAGLTEEEMLTDCLHRSDFFYGTAFERQASMLRRELKDFLVSYQVEECFLQLLNAGFYNLNDLVAAMKTEPLGIDDLRGMGICRLGIIVKLLLVLDTVAGNIPPMNVVFKKKFEVNLEKKQIFWGKTINSIELWLDEIGLSEETPKFLKEGFDDLSVLYKQTQSRYPMTESLLESIQIKNSFNRRRILDKLSTDCKVYLGRRMQENVKIKCIIF